MTSPITAAFQDEKARQIQALRQAGYTDDQLLAMNPYRKPRPMPVRRPLNRRVAQAAFSPAPADATLVGDRELQQLRTLLRASHGKAGVEALDSILGMSQTGSRKE
jgi:hypothetical protein